MKTSAIRWIVFVATFIATLAATGGFVLIASSGGFNFLEWLSIPFFAILFGWIAFSFTLATIGYIQLARKQRGRVQRGRQSKTVALTDSDHSQVAINANEHRPESEYDKNQPTAILMPIYNESPHRVFAGLKAMIGDLRERGVLDQFAFYILSDTTNPEVWLAEEAAWAELVESDDVGGSVFYRHRAKNTARKAGNIADFVERWGHLHPFMIVLDADSLMAANTMREMVRRMKDDERLGILQIPPVPVGRESLFARLQQFSASVYGAIFVQGFATWAGDQGNYWGHNAIIRVEAFRQNCDLPVLPGKAPLGGEILSHDFVEAALLVRSGWKVHVATDIAGSYEECPTTLADYAQRDQRWCQGNLQHSKLVLTENYHPVSRWHFASGVMSYLASPLWVVSPHFALPE